MIGAALDFITGRPYGCEGSYVNTMIIVRN
jgi:hypothetical protein